MPAISAYPNPVVNEIRIVVPETWKARSVTFEIYNNNGFPVRHLSKSSADKTTIIQVNDLAEGMYIVKVSCGEESALQHLIKTK